MFSPEKDLSRKIVETLGADGMSISSLDKGLSAQGIKNHRLVLTGYLRALNDLGYLRVRDVPPSKIYVPANRLPESLYQAVERQSRALAGIDTDEVILYVLNRLLRRPIFESELRLCGVMRPVGEAADPEVVAESTKLLRRSGNIVPSGSAYAPSKGYPEEYAEVLSALVLEDKNAGHLVMKTKQTRLFRAHSVNNHRGLEADMALKAVIDAIRNYPGVTRKSAIREVVDLLPSDSFPHVVASNGEDAAVIDDGEKYILFATDGIMESLVKSDPFMAGYFAVLVNVNDIAAMGGRPTAMVDVISMADRGTRNRMLRGMEAGVRKFGVPIVGGHTHPDCTYRALDIAVIGTVAKDAVILSSTARPGDSVVMVMDLEGHYAESVPYAWETTMGRSDEVAQAQIGAAARVGSEHLVHAGKDMSNPGSVGTLGMMLECSGMGAAVDLEKIPAPKGCDDLTRWLLAYQGSGFVYSCDPAMSQRVIDIFAEVGCAGAVVGEVDGSGVLRLSMDGEEGVLFDFSKDVIAGCRPREG